MTPFDCPNCKGRQKYMPPHESDDCWDECVCSARPKDCSSCGGSGIDPELVEVLKPFMDVDPAIEPNEWVLAQAHQAKAAAAAVVAYWKEKG